MSVREKGGASAFRHDFLLDPKVGFLNHGSFGACPKPVLQAQSAFRERMEREPVAFLGRELEGLLDSARDVLATFLHASPEDLAFVTNATAGVNTVLRTLSFEPGDELLTTDHVYPACKNALDYAADRHGAVVRVVHVPFPIAGPEEVLSRVVDAMGSRTKLLLIDHVTSPTGLVFPIEDLVREARERGVDVLVDGAHAPGMLELDLDALGAAYYAGNAHKWLCAPKGAAFLHVRRDRQAGLRPLVISHGANSRRTDRSRFRLETDFTGTQDYSPYLAIPAAIDFLGGLLPGGIPELRARNRELVLEARSLLLAALGIARPAPDEMIGSMVSLPLPNPDGTPPKSRLFSDALQERLFEEEHIEVPIFPFPEPPRRLIRISAQIYNDLSAYDALATALKRSLRFEPL